MTKRKGAIIPDPVNPPGTRRVVVCVPDTVEWLSLFTGCVAQMTFGWYWDRSTGDLDAVRDRAKQMYFEMQEQNGLCDVIDCEQVADCIESNANVQSALRALFNNSDNPPGDVLPDAAAAADQAAGTNPTCDLDILWSQCLGVIQIINRAIEDMLEGLETLSNNVEVANALANLPVVDELGVDAVTEYADLMLEGITESYLAQYTNALEQELACLLFCVCRGDCEITIQRIYDVYLARLRSQFADPGAAFFNINEVISYLFDAEIDSDLIVTALHFLIVGGMRLFSGVFGSGALDRIFAVAMSVGASSPLNTWTILCTECAYCHNDDLHATDGDFVRVGASTNGDWTAENGWSVGCDPANCIKQLFIERTFAAPFNLTRFKILYNAQTPTSTDASARIVRLRGFNGATQVFSQQANISYGLNIPYEWTGDVTVDRVEALLIPANLGGSCTCASLGGGAQLTEVEYAGVGDNPFGDDNC